MNSKQRRQARRKAFREGQAHAALVRDRNLPINECSEETLNPYIWRWWPSYAHRRGALPSRVPRVDFMAKAHRAGFFS